MPRSLKDVERGKVINLYAPQQAHKYVCFFVHDAVWSDKDKLKKQNENTPLQRIGYPEDISGIVHFLASDASSFITGQLIIADGGETITSTLT